jgi:hypothetical protein
VEVFLMGLLINCPSKVSRWWPVLVAMLRMLRQLGEHLGPGLLGARSYLSPPHVMVVQVRES